MKTTEDELDKLAYDYAMEDIGKEHYPEFGQTKSHYKDGFRTGERKLKQDLIEMSCRGFELYLRIHTNYDDKKMSEYINDYRELLMNN